MHEYIIMIKNIIENLCTQKTFIGSVIWISYAVSIAIATNVHSRILKTNKFWLVAINIFGESFIKSDFGVWFIIIIIAIFLLFCVIFFNLCFHFYLDSVGLLR